MRLSRSSSLTERETRSRVNSDLRSWPRVAGSAVCGVVAAFCDMATSIDVVNGGRSQAATVIQRRLTLQDASVGSVRLFFGGEFHVRAPLSPRMVFRHLPVLRCDRLREPVSLCAISPGASQRGEDEYRKSWAEEISCSACESCLSAYLRSDFCALYSRHPG